MPCFRHRSLADIPAACSFNTLMICSSVNLPLRIVRLLSGEQNPNSKPGAFQGSRSPSKHDGIVHSIGFLFRSDAPTSLCSKVNFVRGRRTTEIAQGTFPI